MRRYVLLLSPAILSLAIWLAACPGHFTAACPGLFRAARRAHLPAVTTARLSCAEEEQGFILLFNGRDLAGWQGAVDGYEAVEGILVGRPDGGGNLYTDGTYRDFIFRFEFKLQPVGNSGVGIRAPLEGDAAYVGMEVQVLDNTAEEYANLQPYQYHGSVYGIAAAERGHLNPVGQWNSEEIFCRGRQVRVTLNGQVIVDTNLDEATANGTADHRDHPGLDRSEGHIGFLGHGHHVEFRNIRVLPLDEDMVD